jgi:ketosteroid isomerase-like protein
MAITQAAVDTARKAWQEAANRHDSRGLASMYCENAVIVPLAAPAIHGRKGVEHFFAEALKDVTGMRVTKSDSHAISSDVMEEIGEYEFDEKGKKAQHVRGKYVALYQMEGGTCRFHTHIWNREPTTH